jgi:Zn-dependent metalloprotease
MHLRGNEKEIFGGFKKNKKREERYPPHEKIEITDIEKSTQETNNKVECKRIEVEKINKMIELMVAIKKDTEEIKRNIRAISLELKKIIEEWNKRQYVGKSGKIQRGKQTEIEIEIKKLEVEKDQTEDLIERLKHIEQKEEETLRE